MRVWDKFLTERDKTHLATLEEPPRVGFGTTPALLLIDNSKAALGDEPLPLLESIKKYPLSMGLEAWDAVEKTRELLDLCRSLGVLVVHTTMLDGPNTPYEFYSAKRLSPPGRTRTVENARINRTGEEGIYDIVAQLAPAPDEILLHKLAPSAFYGTPLSSILRHFNVDTVIVTGNSTSGCVRATVIDAASEMYRTVVVEECVYDRTEASHAVNLFDMHQKYADVLGIDEVTEWLRSRAAPSRLGHEPVEASVTRMATLGAVVTGAAGGIGSAIAKEFAKEGARVACIDLNADGAKATTDAIAADGGTAWSLEADMTDAAQVGLAARECVEILGRVDVVCTTVGGGLEVPFLDIEADTWRHVIDLNLTSVFLCAQTFARHMVEHGGGTIVVTSSQLAQVAWPGLAHYCAAKGALDQLVKVIALELAPSGVRANALAPGPTLTPQAAEILADSGRYEQVTARIPLGRMGSPKDMARAAVYLACDDSSFMTGATLVVDGGYLIA